MPRIDWKKTTDFLIRNLDYEQCIALVNRMCETPDNATTIDWIEQTFKSMFTPEEDSEFRELFALLSTQPEDTWIVVGQTCYLKGIKPGDVKLSQNSKDYLGAFYEGIGNQVTT